MENQRRKLAHWKFPIILELSEDLKATMCRGYLFISFSLFQMNENQRRTITTPKYSIPPIQSWNAPVESTTIHITVGCNLSYNILFMTFTAWTTTESIKYTASLNSGIVVNLVAIRLHIHLFNKMVERRKQE